MSGSFLHNKFKNKSTVIANLNPKDPSASTILVDAAPISKGSAVFSLQTNKIYLKTSDSQNDYIEISNTPRSEWGWSATGQAAWQTLFQLANPNQSNQYSAPTAITLSHSSILENNSVGAIIGTFSTTDTDLNENFTYTLISGDTNAFTIDGNQLKAAVVFDYEVKSSYSIVVRSTDKYGFYVESTFFININQVIVYLSENIESWNNFSKKTYTENSLVTIKNISEYTSGKIYFHLISSRAGYSSYYGSIQAIIQFSKNENNQYIFSYITNPTPSTRTVDENGNTISQTTYPAVPNDFFVNITNNGDFQIFLSGYGVNATNSTVQYEITDSFLGYEYRTIPLIPDEDAIYSLAIGLYDNDAWEIANNNALKFKTNTLNYEIKNNYIVLLSKTKNSITTTELKTINIVNQNELKLYAGENGFHTWPYLNEYTSDLAWSSAASLNEGIARLAAAGTQNAALAFGGSTVLQNYNFTAYSFNGNSWVSANNLNTGRRFLAGVGTQNAALAIGGTESTNSLYSNAVESFNGSSWMPISTSPSIVGRYGLAGAGSQNDAVIFGGYTGSRVGITENFNGSSWSTNSALNTSRYYLAGTGTSNAALAFGGYTTSSSGITEKFNGSTWTSSIAFTSKRSNLAGAGTQNAAIGFGGDSATTSQTTILFDGTIWSATEALTQMRQELAGTGTQNAALAIGGKISYGNNGVTSAVEKFNGTTYTNPNSSTFIGYLNPLLDPDTEPSFLQNTYTLSNNLDKFEIKNNDELHSKLPISAGINNSFTSIIATDNNNKQGSINSYVYVINRPNSPTDFTLSSVNNSVVTSTSISIASQLAANTSIVSFVVIDPDFHSSGYVYTITNNDTSNFYILSTLLMTSKTTVPGTYILPIRVTDVSGLYFEKNITIYVS